MNTKFFKDEITVYHFDNSEIVTRIHFKQVYFRHNKKSNMIDKGQEKGSTGSITIPTVNKLSIKDGDYIVDGIINDEFNLAVLLKKYQLFKVISVNDNRKGNLQHYKIGVGE